MQPLDEVDEVVITKSVNDEKMVDESEEQENIPFDEVKNSQNQNRMEFEDTADNQSLQSDAVV
jgi:hypothetical protein